jgi:peptidoglycan hydrolase-like protein with peptidoglycan-binding domain
MKARLLSAAALGLLVAACGTNTSDRVGGGAAAGAATGATVGALGGPVGALGGAAIGAGAGAATGALTTPEQVNLGRPVWNDPEVRVGGRSPAGGSSASSSGSSSGSGMSSTGGGRSSSNVRQVQQALNSRGANVSVDGVMGPQTRNALMDFQRQNNIDATGRVDQRTASALGVSSTSGNVAQSGSRSGRSDRDGAYMGGGMVVDQNTGSSAGGSSGAMGGSPANRGAMGSSTTGSGMSNQPMGNTDAQGPDRMGGNRVPPQIGTSGNTGRTGTSNPGAQNTSPSNPGSGSNSAGSSSQ